MNDVNFLKLVKQHPQTFTMNHNLAHQPVAVDDQVLGYVDQLLTYPDDGVQLTVVTPIATEDLANKRASVKQVYVVYGRATPEDTSPVAATAWQKQYFPLSSCFFKWQLPVTHCNLFPAVAGLLPAAPATARAALTSIFDSYPQASVTCLANGMAGAMLFRALVQLTDSQLQRLSGVFTHNTPNASYCVTDDEHKRLYDQRTKLYHYYDQSFVPMTAGRWRKPLGFEIANCQDDQLPEVPDVQNLNARKHHVVASVVKRQIAAIYQNYYTQAHRQTVSDSTQAIYLDTAQADVVARDVQQVVGQFCQYYTDRLQQQITNLNHNWETALMAAEQAAPALSRRDILLNLQEQNVTYDSMVEQPKASLRQQITELQRLQQLGSKMSADVDNVKEQLIQTDYDLARLFRALETR